MNLNHVTTLDRENLSLCIRESEPGDTRDDIYLLFWDVPLVSDDLMVGRTRVPLHGGLQV